MAGQLNECRSKEDSASQEKEQLTGRVQELESSNQALQQRNQELEAKIQTLTAQSTAQDGGNVEEVQPGAA